MGAETPTGELQRLKAEIYDLRAEVERLCDELTACRAEMMAAEATVAAEAPFHPAHEWDVPHQGRYISAEELIKLASSTRTLSDHFHDARVYFDVPTRGELS